MNEAFLAFVAEYGVLAILLSTFLSCLLVPIPSSLMMLAGGAFAAAGDLSTVAVAGAAFAGAVAGDQVGFRVGRLGGAALSSAFARRPARAAALGRARALLDRWGGAGVFLSTWLFAPLGPYVNFAAGGAGMTWPRFTVWDAAGEAVWVALYVGLGFAFADQVQQLSGVMGNVVAALAALAVAAGLGWALLHHGRPGR